jgi:adenosylmethionine-8-amino-7-oxononanoate aminotransferase
VPAVFEATRAEGVITRPLGTSLGISPPLTISEEEIALIPAAITAGVEAVAQAG